MVERPVASRPDGYVRPRRDFIGCIKILLVEAKSGITNEAYWG